MTPTGERRIIPATKLPGQNKEDTMPRIRHIALTTKDPGTVAAFYKEAFGMKELRRSSTGAGARGVAAH